MRKERFQKMKKLFSICMDKLSDETIPEEDFLVRNYEDGNLFEELENITKAHVDKVSKSRFKAMGNTLFISLVSVGVTLASVLLINRYAGESDMYNVLLFIPLIFSLIGIISLAKYRKGTAEYASSEEILQTNAEKEETVKKLYESVGVPKTAISVDIIEYTYKFDKNGNEITDGYNTLFRTWVYEQGEMLYFSDEYSVYAFPRESFKEIRYVQSKYSVLETDWTKPTPPASELYANCGITAGKGLVTFSDYLSVKLERGGEAYEFRAAPYEALNLSRISGLTPKR